jgi:hypothetical protein
MQIKYAIVLCNKSNCCVQKQWTFKKLVQTTSNQRVHKKIWLVNISLLSSICCFSLFFWTKIASNFNIVNLYCLFYPEIDIKNILKIKLVLKDLPL